MKDTNLTDELRDLIQIDIDAVGAYDQALKNIDNITVHAQISEFRDDYVAHINNLSKILLSMGIEPPKMTKDLKGFLLKGLTAIRSVTGTEGALKAMESNEKISSRAYQKALELELPSDIRQIVAKNYDDERRHLAYIQETLDSRSFS